MEGYFYMDHAIFGDPGVASCDDAIFSGESLLQEQTSPWALFLAEPIPEMFEFRAADYPQLYFSGQSARRSSRGTLSPSYTKRFFSSLPGLVLWSVSEKKKDS